MGPLTVHPDNPRYFANPEGQAIWLTGSHTWATLQERGIEGKNPDFDYPGYLDFLHSHGHNFFRLWVWEHTQWMQFADAEVPVRYTPPIFQRTGPGLALDGLPKFDLTQFNDAFFERLRERVIEAKRRGIYIGVMFFQGFSVLKPQKDKHSGNNWHGNPFNKENNINGIDGDPAGNDTGHQLHTLTVPAINRFQEAYVRSVIDALNDLDNVIWEIGNELPAESVEFQYYMIRFVRDYEATKLFQHPIGMTGAPVSTTSLMASSADWVSPPDPKWMMNPPAADGSKVMIIDTDHCRAMFHDPAWVWTNFTRANHFILMDGYVDYRIGSPLQPDPKWNTTRDAMGAARRLSEQLDLVKMKPLPKLASSGLCLADPGQTWVVFQSGGDSLTVSTGPGKWHATWLDAITGKVIQQTNVTASQGTVNLQTPKPGNWVLLVTKPQ